MLLVNRECKNRIVLAKDVSGAIAMMNVGVNDERFFDQHIFL